jgi:hypothetical protein
LNMIKVGHISDNCHEKKWWLRGKMYIGLETVLLNSVEMYSTLMSPLCQTW